MKGCGFLWLKPSCLRAPRPWAWGYPAWLQLTAASWVYQLGGSCLSWFMRRDLTCIVCSMDIAAGQMTCEWPDQSLGSARSGKREGWCATCVCHAGTFLALTSVLYHLGMMGYLQNMWGGGRERETGVWPGGPHPAHACGEPLYF